MTNKLFRMFLLGPVITLGAAAMFPDKAQAIPAFARTHEKPCIQCHVAFPKLNDFGTEFEHRGFRMPGDEGSYLWEKPIPLAGKINMQYLSEHIEWDPNLPSKAPMPALDNKKTSALHLFDLQLLTGGTLAPRVSFFGQIIFKVNGLEPDATDGVMMADTLVSETRVEALWVQFDDILSDSKMNLRIGKDHIDNGFLSTPLRLTRASRLIQVQPMLGASLHPMSVGVGLNGMIEAERIGFFYDTGVRNYGAGFDSKEDNEQRLGAYYGFLGTHFMGHSLSLMAASDRRGNANMGMDDAVLGYGASLELHLGPINLVPGYFWYHEGTDVGFHAGSNLDVTSGTVELIYTILPDLYGTARYDFNDWDIDKSSRDLNAKQIVASLAWYPHPNVRWVAEFSRVKTENLFFMRDEVGLQMLMPTMMDTDLKQDTAVLMLEVDF